MMKPSITLDRIENPDRGSETLQRALREYTCVYVSSWLAVNRPITIPSTSRIEGLGNGFIYRLGVADPTEFTVLIEPRVACCPLTRIWVSGSRVSRGVQWDRCENAKLADELTIMSCLGVSAEMLDCCVSGANDLRIKNGSGVAARMYRCNSSHFRGVFSIRGHKCNEESDYQDGIRATVVIEKQDLTRFDNVLFEPVNSGDYPLMYIDGSTIKVDTMRLEAGHHSDAIVRIPGNGAKSGTNIQFDSVLVDSRTHAKTFAELTGTTRHVSVSNLQAHAWQLTESLFRFNGGVHVAPTAEHCFINRKPGFETFKKMNGATIVPTIIKPDLQ